MTEVPLVIKVQWEVTTGLNIINLFYWIIFTFSIILERMDRFVPYLDEFRKVAIEIGLLHLQQILNACFHSLPFVGSATSQVLLTQ
jgi:hypothetical protein